MAPAPLVNAMQHRTLAYSSPLAARAQPIPTATLQPARTASAPCSHWVQYAPTTRAANPTTANTLAGQADILKRRASWAQLATRAELAQIVAREYAAASMRPAGGPAAPVPVEASAATMSTLRRIMRERILHSGGYLRSRIEWPSLRRRLRVPVRQVWAGQ
ncbi:hypothetical protein OC845_006617 [Tilletia horrida]|nr:hypothetical protein OC845_006617 [Tilletia horrida]